MHSLIIKVVDKFRTKAKNFRTKICIFKTKFKYYTNRNTGEPIFWRGGKNRRAGKTTLVIKDAIKYRVPIVVETKKQKLYLLQLAKRMGKPLKVYTAYEDLRGLNTDKVLLDCAGRGWDILQERYPNIKILNGFVYDN